MITWKSYVLTRATLEKSMRLSKCKAFPFQNLDFNINVKTQKVIITR